MLLANRLKHCRLKKGMDVCNIAEELKISASYYYKIEQGTRTPSIILAKKISSILEKDLDYLFFNT